MSGAGGWTPPRLSFVSPPRASSEELYNPSMVPRLDLSAAHLKMERARKHICDFDSEKAVFLSSNLYLCIPQFDPESRRTRFVLGPLPSLPRNFALVAGDAIHNLRVALDYVANEMVRSSGGSDKNVYFPIFDDEQKYKTESASRTKGIAADFKSSIDRLRPYRGGNDDLYGLHRLDITDKHRLLITIATRTSGLTIGKGVPNLKIISLPFNSTPAKEGDILGELEGEHQTSGGLKFTFDIAFGEPHVFYGSPVVATLGRLAGVVEGILSTLEV